MKHFRWSLAALLMSCAPAVDFGRPPDVRLGMDECDHCRMIINEARFAAAYYDAQASPRRFDDIRCLVEDLAGRGPPGHPIWVHDYLHDRWLRADQAVFVRDAGIHTAMGSGIVAVSSAHAAASLIGDGEGSVVAFHELMGR